MQDNAIFGGICSTKKVEQQGLALDQTDPAIIKI